jgi:hypothetical protein
LLLLILMPVSCPYHGPVPRSTLLLLLLGWSLACRAPLHHQHSRLLLLLLLWRRLHLLLLLLLVGGSLLLLQLLLRQSVLLHSMQHLL